MVEVSFCKFGVNKYFLLISDNGFLFSYVFTLCFCFYFNIFKFKSKFFVFYLIQKKKWNFNRINTYFDHSKSVIKSVLNPIKNSQINWGWKKSHIFHTNNFHCEFNLFFPEFVVIHFAKQSLNYKTFPQTKSDEKMKTFPIITNAEIH